MQLKSYHHNLISAVLVISVATVVVRTWVDFSFVYTDMDQVLMWTAAQLMSMGEWHGLRFYGQDYGTMIEAILASPFAFLEWHHVLPMVTTGLFLLPFGLIILKNQGRRRAAILILSLLAAMPIEYTMTGTMSRDFLPGIAIASLGVRWLQSGKKWMGVLVGAMALLGWYVNQSAALLGGFISMLAVFDSSNQSIDWKRFMYVSSGYLAIGLGILVWNWLDASHQPIVHPGWDFHFAFKQLKDGLLNMDRHFKWITPLFHRQGWMLLVLIAAMSFALWKQKDRAAAAGLAIVMVMVVFSLGVLKIHDGRDSVFFSHERMFLALPVVLGLALVRLKCNSVVLLATAVLGIGNLAFQHLRFNEAVSYHTHSDRDHVAMVMQVDQFKATCKDLNELARAEKSDLIVAGPMDTQLGLMISCGYRSLYPEQLVIDPGYERKTWEMRQVASHSHERLIWLGSQLPPMEDANFSLRNLGKVGPRQCEAWLIEGAELSPLELYRSMGRKTSSY